ncbi:MAG TPA: TadE/TadG family type IV pilus assembly protein [Bradyrhizobium sp.]|nr:TadE/TadG family type IV pilus assembly protein [Bradyrhizobium sp.]
MLGAFIRPVREAAARFIGANKGNVAVIFTIAAVPVISFVGAAIDYSRMNDARSSMQSALDSTALMLSKDLSSGKITASEVNSTAQAYFSGLYSQSGTNGITISATYNPDNGNLGSTITINGSGSINTDFLNVIGFPTLSFGTSSTTAWGNVKMRVALALDNTGSMKDNGKITALRNAVAGSGGLIDQLSALAKNDGDVLISVIPFAKVVNVGTDFAGADWIDWTDWQNPPTQQPNNNAYGGNYEAAIPNSKFSSAQWAAIGPNSSCPFTSSNGFPYIHGCVTAPGGTSTASKISSTSITVNGHIVQNPICPGYDTASQTKYNGCWDSVMGTITVCNGSNCSNNSTTAKATSACQKNYPSCTCTGSGSSTVCTANSNTYTHTWYANSTSAWTGCVTDRDQPYDAQGDAPTLNITSSLFPANEYYSNSESYCNPSNSPPLEQLVPLSDNWSSLKSMVNAMQPTGGTNQAIGLAWAWQSLQTTGPIPAPEEDSNYTYNRVIIILSDGLNTEDRWPAYGDGSTQNTNSSGVGYIDARQALLCQNLKSQIDPKTGLPMYTIYTIQVDTSTPADPTSQVLYNCASDPSKFFLLTSSSQIVTTFNTIGNALSELRVAR